MIPDREKAKQILTNAGYNMTGLLHINRVQKRFKCDRETAFQILEKIANHNDVIDEIDHLIDDIAEDDFNLEREDNEV